MSQWPHPRRRVVQTSGNALFRNNLPTFTRKRGMQSALCCAMNDHRDSYRSSSQGSEIEALDVRVPLLRLKGSTWDAVALETWLEALSGLLAPELPHDLMALWVYPPEGPAVLGQAHAHPEITMHTPSPAR